MKFECFPPQKKIIIIIIHLTHVILLTDLIQNNKVD